jgi:hypothetical protein
MDEQNMQAVEQEEDKELQQILQLCQSGDPKALQQIAQIVQQLLAHNQQEEQGQGEAQQGNPEAATRQKMIDAVKNQMGE